MTRKLTANSTLDTVRKDAKRWLKALGAGDAKARARLSAAWPGGPEPPALRDVQHAIAREYGLADWKALKAALEDLATDRLSRQERAETVLRHGWDGSLSVARRIVERDPGLAKTSLAMACACGDLEEVERRLAKNPALANVITGPLKWTPLHYVAFSRLPGPGADNAVAIAGMLLDLGADPNFEADDGWENPFKALTGVIGQGEGVKPTHARADELVALLIERGAEPFDTQALYNTSIVGRLLAWTARCSAVSPSSPAPVTSTPSEISRSTTSARPSMAACTRGRELPTYWGWRASISRTATSSIRMQAAWKA